ncbi:MAG TPA: DUF4352 domain-containing protein [Ktedonobacteraceae bacterium]|jgi:flagellar basal body-associated protein FliL
MQQYPNYPQQVPDQPPIQYSQYPQYPQQPYQEPPKKKRRIWLWALIGMVVIFAMCSIFALLPSKGSNSNTSATSITPTPSHSNNSSSSSTSQNKPNDPVSVADTWQVTIGNITTNDGDAISQPDAGNVYLQIGVSLKNISDQTQTASSVLMWDLKDTSGKQYDPVLLTSANSPDGDVGAGQSLQGTLVYEVPQSTTSFTLSFTSDLDSTPVEWDISAQ